LNRSEKVEQHISNKTQKLIALRFRVGDGINSLGGFGSNLIVVTSPPSKHPINGIKASTKAVHK